MSLSLALRAAASTRAVLLVLRGSVAPRAVVFPIPRAEPCGAAAVGGRARALAR